MSAKTTDEGEVFTCDQCGKVSAVGVGLPDGWAQIAVARPSNLKDRYKQFCSPTCRRAHDKESAA